MRKSFITKQYENVPIAGTFSTEEKRHFFGGKMLEIEDIINISNTNTQHIFHNMKRQHLSRPNIAPNQTSFEQYNSTKWIVEFDANALLTEYLYRQLMLTNFDDSAPNYFTEIDPVNTSSKRLYSMVLEYIDKNVIGRYRLSKVLMWTKYYSLGTGSIIIDGEKTMLTQYNPIFHPIAKASKTDLELKNTAETLYFVPKGDKYEISFKQSQAARLFTFAYYIDVVYEKI
jgi:hypothetical protein